MEKFYSKADPNLLLHIVVRFSDFNQERLDVIDTDNFLQFSLLRFDEGRTFKPHSHITNSIDYTESKAQESWVVLRGVVKCTFYDIDDSVLAEPVLNERDACFTLDGGHTFTILEDHTCVMEFKTGPYSGQINDKRFIDA